jgi:hypothetical protein
MISRRSFLSYLATSSIAFLVSKKTFTDNLTVFDKNAKNVEFIIIDGWVLLKTDLETANDY